MGKWATYRKRGAPQTAPTTNLAPPAPLLSKAGGNLSQSARGAADTGGQLILQWSTDGGLTWETTNTAPWEAEHFWDTIGNLDPGAYRAFEVGNGVTYIGTSGPSVTVNVP